MLLALALLPALWKGVRAGKGGGAVHPALRWVLALQGAAIGLCAPPLTQPPATS